MLNPARNPLERGAGTRRGERAVYQLVWRWHFLAGLLVMPFLVMMAITGGAYLFKDEITHVVYRPLIEVPVRSAPLAPASLVVRRTEAALGGTVLQFSPPEAADRSARMIVRVPSGKALTAYADPYDGHLLGAIPYGGIMQTVRKIHSLQRFGFWASSLIEIAAGWALVLVASGVYLWWPRGRTGGIVSVRGTPRTRIFWRDAHAVSGIFVGLVIAFLAATGMPWSMFWGAKVQSWVGRHQLAGPPAPAYTQFEELMGMTVPPAAKRAPAAGLPAAPSAEVASELPWTLGRAGAPEGVMPGMPGMEAPPAATSTTAAVPLIGIDRALAEFRALGVTGSFGLALPIGPKSAYVANYRTERVEDTRTVYLDPYTGQLLGDIRFRDYHLPGKAIQWGTAVHMGQQFGPINRGVTLAGCLGVVFLAVSSFTMWWKRRPAGGMGIPGVPDDPRVARGLLGIMIPMGLLFPLLGASMLLGLAIEFFASATSRTGSAARFPSS